VWRDRDRTRGQRRKKHKNHSDMFQGKREQLRPARHKLSRQWQGQRGLPQKGRIKKKKQITKKSVKREKSRRGATTATACNEFPNLKREGERKGEKTVFQVVERQCHNDGQVRNRKGSSSNEGKG